MLSNSRTIKATLLGFLIFVAAYTPETSAQEQQVLWRQIKIGSYTVVWPAAQGAAASTTCLSNDGTGALNWGPCGGGGGEWTEIDGVLYETTMANHVAIGGDAAASDLRFMENSANGGNYVGFKAPATLAGDVIWVLPVADGSGGQVIKTDGAGNLSWTATSGSHPDPHRLAAGTAAAPAYSFGSDTNTGIWNYAADKLAITTGAATKAFFSAGGAGQSILTMTATGAGTYNTLQSVLADGTTHAIFNSDATAWKFAAGTALLPVLTFGSDPNTGIWNYAADKLAITTGGQTKAIFHDNGAGKTVLNLTAATGGTANMLYSTLSDSTTYAPLTLNATALSLYAGTYANIGPTLNGTLYWCSDCTIGACGTAGTGALAVRTNGAWRCL